MEGISSVKYLLKMNNCPIGSNIKNAPWNEVTHPEKEVEVTVSITLSKQVKVKVDDYEVIEDGIDEDGHYYEELDYSNVDFKEKVLNKIVLPNEACEILKKVSKEISDKDDFKDIDGWNVNEFEVTL